MRLVENTPPSPAAYICGTTRGEIATLTGIRAFAAWWVVMYHLAPAFSALAPGSRPYLWLVKNGDSGVDLFFILSGFVLAYNYADKFSPFSRSGYLRFLWLRLARIYPTHVFALAVWVLFIIANHFLKHKSLEAGYFSLPTFLANLLLVHGWSIPMKLSWNYPAWSISMEWLAYIGFPFLMLLVGRIRSGAVIIFVVSVLALGSPLLRTSDYSHLARIFSEFGIGCLLYRLYSRHAVTLLRWDIVSAVALACIVVLAAALKAFIVPVLVVAVYSAALERGVASAVLGSRIATYWGRVSYSLYMMHAAVISALHVLIPPERFASSGALIRLCILLAYVGAIGFVGATVYHTVEEPLRAKMRSLSKTKRAVLAATAS